MFSIISSSIVDFIVVIGLCLDGSLAKAKSCPASSVFFVEYCQFLELDYGSGTELVKLKSSTHHLSNTHVFINLQRYVWNYQVDSNIFDGHIDDLRSL